MLDNQNNSKLIYLKDYKMRREILTLGKERKYQNYKKK